MGEPGGKVKAILRAGEESEVLHWQLLRIRKLEVTIVGIVLETQDKFRVSQASVVHRKNV